MDSLHNNSNNTSKNNGNNNSQLFESFILFQKFMDSFIKANNVNQSKSDKDTNEKYLKNNKTKSCKDIFNYDDRPICHSNISFVELVEKNLNELKESENRLSSCASCPKNKLNESDLSFSFHNSNNNIYNNYKDNSISNKQSINTSSDFKNNSCLVRKRSRNKIETKNKSMSAKNISSINNNESGIKTLNLNNNTVINQNFINSTNKSISLSKSLFKDDLASNGKETIYNNENDSFTSSKSNDIIYNYSSYDDDIPNEPYSMSQPQKRDSKTKWRRDIRMVKQKANEINSQISYVKLTSPTFIHRNDNSKKSKQLMKEFEILREEQEKFEKMKKDFSNYKTIFNQKVEEFNKKKIKDMEEFEQWKKEEIKKFKQSIENNKDNNMIEQLKNQVKQMQSELNCKDKNYKVIIETLKIELSKAHKTINDLLKKLKLYQSKQSNQSSKIKTINPKTLLSQTINKKMKKNSSQPHYNINKIKEKISQSQNMKPKEKPNSKVNLNSSVVSHPSIDCTVVDDLLIDLKIPKNTKKKSFNISKESFEMVFPEKYKLDKKGKVFSKEKTKDGKLIIEYENNAKELFFPSGVREEVFEDGYKIIYYTNKDIKQIYPDGKVVYFFFNSKITQTYLPSLNVHIYRYQNGTLEKHYANGKKELLVLK